MSRYYNDFSDSHDEALEHHGILGQKWGIRRYQNENGTLTAEGRKKYGADAASYGYKRLRKQVLSADKSAYKNTSQVFAKRDKEYQATDEYKNAKAMTKFIQDTQDTFRKEHPNSQMYWDADSIRTMQSVYGKANAKQREITLKYVDELSDTALKDLGYQNTQSGHDMVKKILLDYDRKSNG